MVLKAGKSYGITQPMHFRSFVFGILSGFFAQTVLADTYVKGSLRFDNQQYLVSMDERSDLNQERAISLGLNFSQENNYVTSKFDGILTSYVDTKGSRLMVKEGYVSKDYPDSQISLGRRMYVWNESDDFWDMGLWQPQNKWDGLNPVECGFIGLFTGLEGDWVDVLFMVSPINIPTLGPDTYENKGQILAKGRWFSSPGKELTFRNIPTPIHYSLDMPPTSEMVLHPGFGALANIGNYKNGAWMRLALAQKPVNQVLGQISGVLKLGDSETAPYGDVVVHPYITDHTVASMDVGVTFEKNKTWISVLADEPKNITPTEGWTAQKLYPLRAYSIGSSFKLWRIAGESAKFGMSYIKVTGGGSFDEGPHANPQKPLFVGRVDFRDAIMLKLNAPLANWLGTKIYNDLRWIRDYEQDGMTVSTEFRIQPNSNMYMYIGADLLGVYNYEDNNSNQFLNQNRANDRYTAGVTYVF